MRLLAFASAILLAWTQVAPANPLPVTGAGTAGGGGGGGGGLACTTNGSDGYASAPAGTPQRPDLLTGYSAVPGWCVAGVHYAVGIPAGTSLTAWTAYSGNPGVCAVDADTNHWIRCDCPDSTPITVSGVDFSTSNGGYLYLNNCTTPHVKWAKFAGGSNLTGKFYFIQEAGTSTGLTVDYSDFDGGGSSSIIGNNSGTVVVMYNRFIHARQHVLEVANKAGPNTACDQTTAVTYKYNFIDTGNIDAGAHMNYQQVGCGTVDADVEYNTSYHDSLPAGVTAGEGWQFYCVFTCTMHSPTFSNNTMVTVQSGGNNTTSYLMHGPSSDAGTTLTGTCNVNSNYSDPRGAIGTFYTGAQAGCAASGNTNMNTGAAITP